VLNDLVRRLDAGEFDSRFPTDRELMEQYDVSRHTVREAVRLLQDSGRVSRHPGRGSQVRGGAFEQPLGTVYSLFESIEAAGASQISVVVGKEMQKNTLAAGVLGLDETDEIFYLERIRLADGEPLAHDRVWLPADLARPLLGVDFTRTALYAELRDHCGVGPEDGQERIKPVIPNDRHAGYLELESGQPALEIERRTNSHGAPLEWRITLVRGDRYSFRAEWNAEDTLVVPRLVAG
jgi:GntR family transcriptional regulator